MTEQGLFGELPVQEAKKRPIAAGDPRLVEPERDGVELRASSLDSLIGADHPARLFWAYVVELDLRELEARVKARDGVAGRPAISPRLLLALWLYATSEGVVSARLLERLCERDDAYRWLCGGVGVNHRTLGEFRVEQGALLNRLLAQSVTALAMQDLIDLDALSQDGVRVRASAGASSFRRQGTLERQVAQVEAIMAELAKQVDGDASQNERQVRARKARHAAERLSRLKAAAAKVAELQDKRAKDEAKQAKADAPPKPDKQSKPPRVSSTDIDARVIKMADGGFRPAYNMQIASVAGGQIVVAVDVSTSSSDRGLARPMLEQIDETYGTMPTKHLIDGGFTKNDDIEWAHDANVTMYCPPTTNKHKTDPFEPRDDDGPGVAQWRERMKSEAGQVLYRLRAIHECINARFRQWGLAQLTVRGKAKAIVVLTWYALANNILQGERLRQAAAVRHEPLAVVA